MALVFQYGSNCAESQINGKDRLCGDAKFVAIAETVDGYRVAFDVWSTARGCAASDIIASPGNKVWGVLYDVPDFLIGRQTAAKHNRKSLDAIEGEGTNYARYSIPVKSTTGQTFTAITYRVIHPKSDLKTGLEYVGYIVSGLREHGVAEEYVAHVKATAIANNPTIAVQLEALYAKCRERRVAHIADIAIGFRHQRANVGGAAAIS